MLQATATVGISTGRPRDMSASSSRSGQQHPWRRKSKDGGGGGGRTSGLWCTSGQRSPNSSFEATSPYDIPHLARPPSASNPPGCSACDHPPADDDYDDKFSMLRKTESEDSGVHSGKEDASNSSSSSSDHRPRRLPPSGSSRPASASAVKLSQRTHPAPVSNPDCEVVAPKSRLFRSLSSFSLKKTFSLHRKGKPPAEVGAAIKTTSGVTGSEMEHSRKRIGGSLPGDDRLNLSNSTTGTEEEDTDRDRKRTHTAAQHLSRLGRSFRRRRSADRVPPAEVRNPDRCSESSSTTSSSSSTSAIHQAVVLYGTASRGRRSSFKISISAPTFDSNGNPPSSAPDRDFPSIPTHLSLPDGVRLVKIFKLEQYVTNKWISGIAVSDKNELVLVDLRSAYLVDDWGNLIRTIGSKGSDRLVEPIGVSVGPEGRLVFSDHAQQNVKVFTNRGSHVRTITDFSLANIAGVACDRATGEIFVAGTDRKRIFVHGGGGTNGGQTRTVPKDNGGSQPNQAVFKHPFSVAFNPVSGEIIVGDDYDQSVMGVTKEGRLAWRFCPPTQDGERQFFPSSVCVDQLGYIFVADLYNGKVCMLDARGQLIRVLLSRDFGLSGNPGAIATDGKGHIFVADEERTVKMFRYRKSS